MTNKLPKGWVWAKLGEILFAKKGKKPKKLVLKQDEKCNLPYLTIEALEKNEIKYYTNGEGCIMSTSQDILVVWDGARFGWVSIGKRGAVCSTMQRLRLLEGNPKYLLYFLKYKFLDVNLKPKGTGTPHVNPDFFWNIHFPLPPLPEQHRIVAKIEELFAKLDAGVEALKKIKKQIKQYRQAVLKYAFEGKLTEEWRQQMANDELKMLNEHSKLKKLPEGWKWTKIDEIGEVVTGTTPSKSKSEYYGKDFPFYKPTDLNNGYYVRKSQDGLSLKGIEKARLLPLKSVLVTCIGATIGKTGLIRKVGASNQQINAIIPKKSVLPEYVYFICISPQFQKSIIDNASATTLPILNKSKFRNLKVPLPPLPEQHKIVEEIEKRFSVADGVEKVVEQSLKQAERLRKSILKNAFEGKLVPQDPSDEPAEKLLERIKAEKERLKREKKVGKKRKKKGKRGV